MEVVKGMSQIEKSRGWHHSLIIADSEVAAQKIAQRFGLTDLTFLGDDKACDEQWIMNCQKKEPTNFYALLSKKEVEMMWPEGAGNAPGPRILTEILRKRGWASAVIFVIGEVVLTVGGTTWPLRTCNSGLGVFAPMFRRIGPQVFSEAELDELLAK